MREPPPTVPPVRPGVIRFRRSGGSGQVTCKACRHFLDDPAELEKFFAGIGALSSAYGSTRGRAGICGKDDSFHDPAPACVDFEPQGHG